MTHSFLRASDGTYTVFDPPGTGSKGSSATGINANGVVVGNYTDSNLVSHGYIRKTDGSFTTIDDPNAPLTGIFALGTYINHVNAAGAIVGVYFDGNRARHCEAWLPLAIM
jgi:uncharacterized membrane protein